MASRYFWATFYDEGVRDGELLWIDSRTGSIAVYQDNTHLLSDERKDKSGLNSGELEYVPGYGLVTVDFVTFEDPSDSRKDITTQSIFSIKPGVGGVGSFVTDHIVSLSYPYPDANNPHLPVIHSIFTGPDGRLLGIFAPPDPLARNSIQHLDMSTGRLSKLVDLPTSVRIDGQTFQMDWRDGFSVDGELYVYGIANGYNESFSIFQISNNRVQLVNTLPYNASHGGIISDGNDLYASGWKKDDSFDLIENGSDYIYSIDDHTYQSTQLANLTGVEPLVGDGGILYLAPSQSSIVPVVPLTPVEVVPTARGAKAERDLGEVTSATGQLVQDRVSPSDVSDTFSFTLDRAAKITWVAKVEDDDTTTTTFTSFYDKGLNLLTASAVERPEQLQDYTVSIGKIGFAAGAVNVVRTPTGAISEGNLGEVSPTKPTIITQALGVSDISDTFSFSLHAPAVVTWSTTVDGDPATLKIFKRHYDAGEHLVTVAPDAPSDLLVGYTLKVDNIRYDVRTTEDDFSLDVFKSFLTALGGGLSAAELQTDIQYIVNRKATISTYLHTLGEHFGKLGLAVDIADHIVDINEAVAHGDTLEKAVFVEAAELLVKNTLLAGAGAAFGILGSLGGPLGGLIGVGAGRVVGGIVYDKFIEDVVEDELDGLYEQIATSQIAMKMINTLNIVDHAVTDLELSIFDTSYYLDTNLEAFQAVTSGRIASAYAHFVNSGAVAGFTPNAQRGPVDPSTLQHASPSSLVWADTRPDLFAIDLSDLVGDGLSTAERVLALQIGGMRGEPVPVSAELSAAANRKAWDLLHNWSESPVGRIAEGRADWADDWSGGLPLAQGLQALGVSGVVDVLAFASAGEQPADALQRFLATAEVRGAIQNDAVTQIGVAEYQGVWVIILGSGAMDSAAPNDSGPLTAFRWAGSGDDLLFAGTWAGSLSGGAGNDQIVGGSLADDLRGGAGNDVLSGKNGDDRLYGTQGDDRADGGAGNDFIFGGAGRDNLIGAAGNDFLYGGADRDVMRGGDGKDRFVWEQRADIGFSPATRDLVLDFVQGEDKLDLRRVDGDIRTDGQQRLTFIDTAEFTDVSQVRVVAGGTRTFVQLNIDDDFAPESMFELRSHIDLTTRDFLL